MSLCFLLSPIATSSVRADDTQLHGPLQPSMQSVVVTATRSPASAFELPAAIDRIDGDAIQSGQLQINLSESLQRVPGVIAHNRQNYAQDLQISMRGFGARSTFGVRGIRILVDGIPATMPDGQGQISHIDLASAARIEVLRGPFSALYGNASGGVIAISSATAPLQNTVAFDVEGGSDGLLREGVRAAGAYDATNYFFSAGNFKTDGYRDHSSTRRSNLNSGVTIKPDAASALKIVLNAVDMPNADDPLGLTRAQFKDDPRQAGTGALAFDTRKSLQQQQLGFNYTRDLDPHNAINSVLYGGQRSAVQYQSIPTASQTAATSPGGVIDLDRRYGGFDSHWQHTRDLANRPLQIVAGFSVDDLHEDRSGFQNFVGSTLGEKGELRRDEQNRVYNVDQYLQAQWQGDAWTLMAGVRHSDVHFRSDDDYILAGNGDDSGSRRYQATTPAMAASYRINTRTQIYTAFGNGFETPTFNELAYRSVNGVTTGLNFPLRASTSRHAEVGVKYLLDESGYFNASAFRITSENELAVAANSGGRAVYQNAGDTAREGLETALALRWSNGWEASAAYTVLSAVYAEDFASCSGTPCTAPTLVSSGNRIPGIPQQTLHGELLWRNSVGNFVTALEAHRESEIYVDDANSDWAAAYTTLNWRMGFTQKLDRWQLEEFFRIDNLTDANYAGSVIVNESNKRFFEPAPERSFYLGIKITSAGSAGK